LATELVVRTDARSVKMTAARARHGGSFDVVVVGFGLAGASVAIDAASAGLSVAVIERFAGGGSSALSAGIIYAGGGTKYQQEAGVSDTVDHMYAYLQAEIGNIVLDTTLRKFCEDSVENLAWLEEQGVPFSSTLCPFRTAHPTDEYFLYHSGSELAKPFSDLAAPAARGHRTVGTGRAGTVMFDRLTARCDQLGVTVVRNARATKLLNTGDRVNGVEFQSFAPERVRLAYATSKIMHATRKLSLYAPPAAAPLNAMVRRIERRVSHRTQVGASRGVVLAAGGFGANQQMVDRFAPAYSKGRPTGTMADDGSGIRLGQSVGAAVKHMERVSGWRNTAPPESMCRGVLVGPSGRRVCNEQFYGARIGRHVAEEHGGRAWMIFDQRIVQQIRAEMDEQTTWWQRAQIQPALALAAHRETRTFEALARRIGADELGLAATLSEYNRRASVGEPDLMGKATEFVQPLSSPPFVAIDMGTASKLLPFLRISMGGLAVDEKTGAVLRDDGSTVKGLYAAGRNAVGICTGSYVSGLSLADCVFTGRRAARSLVDTPSQPYRRSANSTWEVWPTGVEAGKGAARGGTASRRTTT
jgi:3-oxo-5alpha-steroid 4-dehydrogenase